VAEAFAGVARVGAGDRVPGAYLSPRAVAGRPRVRLRRAGPGERAGGPAPVRTSVAFRREEMNEARRFRGSTGLGLQKGITVVDGEVGEEDLVVLSARVLLVLEILDLLLQLLDLRLLIVKLLQITLVGRRLLGHLPQVLPQPILVIGDDLELPLQLL